MIVFYDFFDDIQVDFWVLWFLGCICIVFELLYYCWVVVFVVLICEVDFCVLFMVCLSELLIYKGQIVFLGGSFDVGEMFIQVVLCEVQEEVVFDFVVVILFGEFDDVFMLVGFYVMLVLGCIVFEVFDILWVMLEVVQIIILILVELWVVLLVCECCILFDGIEVLFYCYFWCGFDIWGMMVWVLYDLLEQGLG